VLEGNFGCDLTANSCSIDSPNRNDQIENYMDYADDDCVNMFTDDQKAIMRNNLSISNRRGYLVTATNQTNTGIDPASFLVRRKQISRRVKRSFVMAPPSNSRTSAVW
jgi:hypothetical protein